MSFGRMKYLGKDSKSFCNNIAECSFMGSTGIDHNVETVFRNVK